MEKVVSAPKTILEKRNRKMQITQGRLQSIIFEEYLKEEGLIDEAMSQERADEFIAWIKGKGEKPEWLDRDYGPGSYKRKKGAQAPANDPNVDRSAETMPIDMDISADDADTMPLSADDMPQYDDEDVDDGGAYDPDAEMHGPSDIPSDDAPERDVSGFQDRAGPPLEDQLMDLIQGLPPEEVAALFQAVFEKIPGVELGEPEEEDPDTLYTPGAEGRPQIGFKELKQYIRKVLAEGHYHDMGGEDEMYNALDPHGFDKMSDAELVDAMHTDGMEEMIVFDGEGDLANREEVIMALKNV